MRAKAVAIKPATWLSVLLVGIVIVWAGLDDAHAAQQPLAPFELPLTGAAVGDPGG
ncbi:hypothetical protein [Thiobacter aerophilum]|uniref:Uncharacterized protein n=1 Tax=Thiobacter aerophilum TaxID=3121275 RepID=A0ABV0EE93_9BURK